SGTARRRALLSGSLEFLSRYGAIRNHGNVPPDIALWGNTARNHPASSYVFGNRAEDNRADTPRDPHEIIRAGPSVRTIAPKGNIVPAIPMRRSGDGARDRSRRGGRGMTMPARAHARPEGLVGSGQGGSQDCARHRACLWRRALHGLGMPIGPPSRWRSV